MLRFRNISSIPSLSRGSLHRCYGVTSWQPCLSTRNHRNLLNTARHIRAIAASAEQATATTEAPKAKSQQQKKQANQKGGRNAGGKNDKKSELAVTPKSEDFARYCSVRYFSSADLHAQKITVQTDDPAITCTELKHLQGHAADIVLYDNTALVTDGTWTLSVKPN